MSIMRQNRCPCPGGERSRSHPRTDCPYYGMRTALGPLSEVFGEMFRPEEQAALDDGPWTMDQPKSEPTNSQAVFRWLKPAQKEAIGNAQFIEGVGYTVIAHGNMIAGFNQREIAHKGVLTELGCEIRDIVIEERMKSAKKDFRHIKGYWESINEEKDLRRWIRDNYGPDDAKWIEPSMGSTSGLPDVFFPDDTGWTVWAELKVGTTKDGELRFTVRPEQKQELRSMVKKNMSCGIIVADLLTKVLWGFLPDEEALAGKVGLEGAVEGGWALAVGSCDKESFAQIIRFFEQRQKSVKN